MDKSYFSWPGTCSQGLITFQGAAAIDSKSRGPQMFAARGRLCAYLSE